ncbi:hypothetical protein [Streptomonospora nanhaiensis]|uniref:hypothetical protein n=1 Tax=Streptomonospora nanhaiensis TaxID=1323731 RepID=UPI001C39502A|nr:hypothetical protein [Streptomonospora nanhaiensis]MBV2367117.1 hypothetical protein [Streptomonospora nanhaiensis]
MHADPVLTLLMALALITGHHLGDRWIQTDHQALTKGRPGITGITACAGHVSTLTAAQALMIALVVTVTGVEATATSVGAGLAVTALSHYWADRRETLRGLVLALDPITGKAAYYDHGGAEALDQAWHRAWIVPAALIAASPVVLAALLTALCCAVLAAADLASRHALRAEAHTAA